MKVLQEGALADFLNRFMELILLNVLWFICSLPVFTLGASTCAMYEVTLRWSLQEKLPQSGGRVFYFCRSWSVPGA